VTRVILNFAVAMLALTFAWSAAVMGQETESDAEPGHHAHAAHGVAPVPAEGRRWETDAPLREAMLRIREGVAAQTDAFHAGTLSTDAAQALAAAVETDIQFMFANCQLAPEPDAALHALIGRLLAATAALRTDPESADGLPQLVAVLQDYASTFDQPGWEPIGA
jgi:hypothetical protein